jgi:hypothetical protein
MWHSSSAVGRIVALSALSLLGCGQDGFLVTGSATGETTQTPSTTGLGGLGGGGGAGGVGASGSGGSGAGNNGGASSGGQGGGAPSENCTNAVDDDGDMAIDCADSDCRSSPACGGSGLVLNEIDWDQPNADDAEFIEIYNGGASAAVLDGISLLLINDQGVTYDAIALTGTLASGGFLVVADPMVIVDPGATAVVMGASWSIQQGPDGIALVDMTSSSLIDGLSYGGDIGMVPIGPLMTMVSLVDGTPTPAMESSTLPSSVGRMPNGADTGDDATDWIFRPVPTPGFTN